MRQKAVEVSSRWATRPRWYQQVTPTFDLVSPGLPASSDPAAHHPPTGPLQVGPVLLLVWWLLSNGGTLGDPFL